MDIIGITIIAVIFTFAFAYVLLNAGNEKKIFTYKKNNKEVSKENNLTKEQLEKIEKEKERMTNLIGEKMFDARTQLKKNKFVIDEEFISPIELMGKKQYVKMACFDDEHKKMAIISIVQTAKDALITYYDIDNISKCELEVNDTEVYVKKEETNYELKSMKLHVQRIDAVNPEYTIELLPKLVNNPNKVFRNDYFDFARDIQNKVLENKI